jgi:hypothetical protein
MIKLLEWCLFLPWSMPLLVFVCWLSITKVLTDVEDPKHRSFYSGNKNGQEHPQIHQAVRTPNMLRTILRPIGLARNVGAHNFAYDRSIGHWRRATPLPVKYVLPSYAQNELLHFNPFPLQSSSLLLALEQV